MCTDISVLELFDKTSHDTYHVFQSNEPNETMPISAFAQKQRTTRYMQNLMTPPRAPYPSATTPVLLVF